MTFQVMPRRLEARAARTVAPVERAAEPAGHIVLDGIAKSYGRAEILPGLDLAIARGEFFALLGPSGCGKTTTLRIIAGLEQPTAGRTLLDGRDVTNVPSAKRNVNTVFQSHALFPHMSVYDNVGFGLRVQHVGRAEADSRIREALATVQLVDVDDRFPSELSGGQQQRVALARALVNRPAALLLDEPLGALDLALRRSMQRELKEIQSQTETTFVYVTHDQDEAMVMADRIAVMRDGHLEQVGTPRELYDRPASRFVATFVGASNILSGVAAEGRGGSRRLMVAGTSVPIPEDRAVGNTVQVLIRPERLSLRGVDAPSAGLAGKIVRITFLGSYTEYRVRVGPDVELLVHDPLHDDGRDDRVGDTVEVRWRVADCCVLPAEGGQA